MGNNIPQANKTKITHSGSNDYIEYVCMEMKGWRPQMQDTAIYQLNIDSNIQNQQYKNSLFAVFDGHGTSYISRFVKQKFVQVLTSLQSYKKQQYVQALQRTFELLDKLIISPQGQTLLNKIKSQQDSSCLQSKSHPTGEKIGYLCGSTANVVLITKDYYFVANCGDSRSILCRNGYTIQLSSDHKPQNPTELNRIKKAKGFVNGGRINDMLSVSRAFGDFQFKRANIPYDQQMVTCKPDIQVFGKTNRDQFILIACDGIWENQPKSRTIVDHILKEKYYKKGDYPEALEFLLNKLIAKNQNQYLGMDNMTTLFIKFKNCQLDPNDKPKHEVQKDNYAIENVQQELEDQQR